MVEFLCEVLSRTVALLAGLLTGLVQLPAVGNGRSCRTRPVRFALAWRWPLLGPPGPGEPALVPVRVDQRDVISVSRPDTNCYSTLP